MLSRNHLTIIQRYIRIITTELRKALTELGLEFKHPDWFGKPRPCGWYDVAVNMRENAIHIYPVKDSADFIVIPITSNKQAIKLLFILGVIECPKK